MRLTAFISANVEPILSAWEVFARGIWPSALIDLANDPAELRDHAEAILCAIVDDMQSAQTSAQQTAKSQGQGHSTAQGMFLDHASTRHGIDRLNSGLELVAVVAKYRALRASVIRLWRESQPQPDLHDLDDLTRFHESIDQSLTEAIRSFTEQLQRDRECLLNNDRTAREDAECANRAKDLFLATLSHEIRTPLNSIMGWLTILRLPGHDAANLAEGLDVIERNTKAQVQLIEDLLDVSRIISGKMRLEMQSCDLRDVVAAGVEVVRPTAEAREITLEAHLDPTPAHASCDATRIQQIVWNLLSNALKFSDKGTTVRIALDREASSYRLVVEDHGHGISPETLPYVFDRFRQADSTTRRRYSGLGLGLSIVKHLTEMHGGTVEAQSAGEGQGATFIVRLPIQAVRAHEVDEGEPAPTSVHESSTGPPTHRLDGMHVLVVDDQADARRMLAKVLEGFGARVTTAGSAVEALETLDTASKNEDGPDVLVSDVGMPEHNGYDLIREVRRRGYHATHLPAVALTAFARKDDAHEAAEAGFQMHISKPVDVRDLTAAIATLGDMSARGSRGSNSHA